MYIQHSSIEMSLSFKIILQVAHVIIHHGTIFIHLLILDKNIDNLKWAYLVTNKDMFIVEFVIETWLMEDESISENV